MPMMMRMAIRFNLSYFAFGHILSNVVWLVSAIFIICWFAIPNITASNRQIAYHSYAKYLQYEEISIMEFSAVSELNTICNGYAKRAIDANHSVLNGCEIPIAICPG